MKIWLCTALISHPEERKMGLWGGLSASDDPAQLVEGITNDLLVRRPGWSVVKVEIAECAEALRDLGWAAVT